jgi:hypothetical protein
MASNFADALETRPRPWQQGAMKRLATASAGGVTTALIVLPILDIYRRYYGLRPAAVLFVLFYAAMVLAGYVVELVFGAAGLVPTRRGLQVVEQGFAWNYTTWLNLGFLILAAELVWRFLKTGGPEMLKQMEHAGGHGHEHHAH